MKYTLSEADLERDQNNFMHHAPTSEDMVLRYAYNRSGCLELAKRFRCNCPPSRELSLALTKLEEAMFWANAAIARTED